MKTKTVKISILIITAVFAVFGGYRIYQFLTRPGIPVYMYHSIRQEPLSADAALSVRPHDFEQQLCFLKQEGYTPIFADELLHAEKAAHPVVITLDDGYVDNYTQAYPLLKKYGLKATIFMVSDDIGKEGYLTREQLKEMSDSGVISIQSHTASHLNLKELTTAQVQAQMKTSKEILSAVTGKEVTALSYPGGFWNEQIASDASKYYKIAFITFGAHTYEQKKRYQIPRAGIFRDTSLEKMKQITRERTKSKLENISGILGIS